MSWLIRPPHTVLLRRVRVVLPIVLVNLLAGCGTTRDMLAVESVKPWQRGELADDDMQLINDAMDQAVDDHIHFSREASTGGAVLQGGGCGCN